MFKRRKLLVGAAAGAGMIVMTRPKTAEASFVGLFFAMASLGIMIAGLVQEARERRAWQNLINDGANWRRRSQIKPEERFNSSKAASLKRQAKWLGWRGRSISGPDDARIDAHELFEPDGSMFVPHTSATSVGSEVATIDLEHLHRHAHGVGGGLNESESLSVGQYFQDSGQIALAPISRRRLPLVLPDDLASFSSLRAGSNSQVERHALPVYSRDFISQGGKIHTGFAVARENLKRSTIDNLIDGFRSDERDKVLADLRYAIVFA